MKKKITKYILLKILILFHLIYIIIHQKYFFFFINKKKIKKLMYDFEKIPNLKNSSFSKINNIFLYKKDEYKFNKKNMIHLCMALDNKMIYPTLISMVSALENKKNENILVYYLLLSHNFITSNISIFEDLKNTYEVRINYYIIPRIFNNLKKWRGETDTIYYKLLIPLLFDHLDRIIYLDSDTLIYNDLWEMYNLPFNDNYILAPPSPFHHLTEKYQMDYKYYVNGGVILFNIKKIRKDNIDFKLLYYATIYDKKFILLEQDIINFTLKPKIGLLSFKYGIYLIGNIYIYKKYLLKKFKNMVSLKEVRDAINNPVIVHLIFCQPKVWYINRTRSNFNLDSICKKYQKHFYFFASKTKYYSKIYNKYLN